MEVHGINRTNAYSFRTYHRVKNGFVHLKNLGFIVEECLLQKIFTEPLRINCTLAWLFSFGKTFFALENAYRL